VGYSRAGRTDCPFQADNWRGQRRSHPHWWQALGRIFTEEHSNVFLYEPGGVVGSQDHACSEAQRCIGKGLYDHTVSMKACRRRVRKDVSSRSPRLRSLRCAPESVNSGTAADRDLGSPNQCGFSTSQDWRNRGLWYSHTGQQGIPVGQQAAMAKQGRKAA
jgi:hypothetical protein